MARRIIPGTKPPAWSASALNAAIEMADRQREFSGPPAPAVPGSPMAFAPHLVTACKNLTGQDLKERSIVGIKETAFDLPDLDGCNGDEATPAVLAGEPVDVELVDPSKHTAGRWGVTLGPIPDGECGYLVIAGLVKVRLDVTDASHEFAVPIVGETDYLASSAGSTATNDCDVDPDHATSGAGGTPVTWRKKGYGEDSTGLQWAQINLGSGGGGEGGGGGLAIQGLVCVAEEAVPEPEVISIGDVPDHLLTGISLAEGTVYRCHRADAQGYVVLVDPEDPTYIYLVPDGESFPPIYNTAGEVTAGSVLQTKTVVTPNGERIRLVDVEHCGGGGGGGS